jgi:hypothetical protein
LRTKLDTKTVRKHMNTETKQQKEKQKKSRQTVEKNKKTARKFSSAAKTRTKCVEKKIPSQKTMPRRKTSLYKRLELILMIQMRCSGTDHFLKSAQHHSQSRESKIRKQQ